MCALDVTDLHGVSDGTDIELFGFGARDVLHRHVVTDELALWEALEGLLSKDLTELTWGSHGLQGSKGGFFDIAEARVRYRDHPLMIPCLWRKRLIVRVHIQHMLVRIEALARWTLYHSMISRGDTPNPRIGLHLIEGRPG